MRDCVKAMVEVVGPLGEPLILAERVMLVEPFTCFGAPFGFVLERAVCRTDLWAPILEAMHGEGLPFRLGHLRLWRVYRGIAGEARREVFVLETARGPFAVSVGNHCMPWQIDSQGRIRDLYLVSQRSFAGWGLDSC